MREGLNAFLSNETVKLHTEYLENLKLRWSVAEKSYPGLSELDLRRLLRLKCSDKEEIIRLKSSIILHECYFSTFGRKNQRSAVLKEEYGSEAEFLYRLYTAGMREDCIGLAIAKGRRGVEIFALNSYSDIIGLDPLLLIDLMEHAYLIDYGFDRCEYLKSAIPYLNISNIDKKFNAGIEKTNKP